MSTPRVVAAVAVAVAFLSTSPATPASDEFLPPNAQPGHCYARVFVPPQYETDQREVITREASSRVEVIPAKYAWVEEEVLVKDASEKIEVVPPVYEWEMQQVLVSPEMKTLEKVPAQFEWTEEQVLVKPAHTVWKKGTGPIQRVDNATGEIMCLVEVPAEYKTVRRRVLKTPESTREVVQPPKYDTVRKRVLKQPATTRRVPIPAEYKTVKVRRLVEPSREEKIEVPAEYATVSQRKLIRDGAMEWREILCETNMSAATVTQVQRALRGAGHSPGEIDGVYGRDTANAVQSFQTAQGLPVGTLTLRTLEALGVAAR